VTPPAVMVRAGAFAYEVMTGSGEVLVLVLLMMWSSFWMECEGDS
jgi:hypothetical protein